MTRKAIILTTQPQITGILVSKTECASCKAACSKKKNTVTLSNPSNFVINENSIVIINTEKKFQFLQGFLALFLPVLSAFAGYFLSTPLMALFSKTPGDAVKSLFVIAFFSITCAIIFFITRFAPLPGKPQITEILQ